MKKLFLSALIVLASATAAPAAVILHVQDATIDSSSAAQSVTLDVYLEETEGTQVDLSTYAVGLRLAPVGVVTITGHSVSTAAHPSVFTGQSPTARAATGYIAGNDRFLTDDLSDANGLPLEASVVNGSRDGLFSITFNVPADTVGAFAVNIDATRTELADDQGTPYDYIADNGLITVNAVPEPSALALGLFALPLLARRRR